MKCIKCIKQTKHYELNDIRRVDNKDAEEKVASGVWKFIAKEEWKAVSRKTKTEEATEEVVTEKVQSKKQLRKQKAEA